MSKVQNLRDYLRRNTLDAVLLSSPEQIVYLSDFSGFSHAERDGYILVTKTAGYILTSPLYSEAVKKIRDFSCVEFTAAEPLSTHLTQLVAKHKLKRIGFESSDLTVSEWNRLKKLFPAFLPIDLSTLRVRKTPEEVRAIKQASQIADTALTMVTKQIHEGMREVDVVLLIEDAIRKQTADIAFPTIVAFGKNAAIPHHKSDKTKLKNNDLILIDFGAAYGEYRSDMTRTFFIGRAPEEQKQAYHAVLEAQQKAVEYIEKQLSSSSSEGAKRLSREANRSSSQLIKARSNNKILASDVDKVARDYLISMGFPSIPHSLGHGIGLAVHEAPRLGPNSEDMLTEGMVFSIEPGVYFPEKFGIRIEDLYTIRNRKLFRLTKAPSSLSEI